MSAEENQDLIQDVALYLATKDLQAWAFTEPKQQTDAAEFERRRYTNRAKDILALIEGHRRSR